jgi:EmrB/QacA subfamily drug resistance transporter
MADAPPEHNDPEPHGSDSPPELAFRATSVTAGADPAQAYADGAEPAADQAVARHPSLALATLCIVLFLTFLDITIVSVALAGLQTQLHAGVSSLQWVVGAYALTFASTMLMFGTIGDQFGRKKVMLIGICIFLFGALLAALSVVIFSPKTSATSALALVIAGRAVMGLGAAASEPGTLSMLRHLYPDFRIRNRAIGIWAAVSGFSLALGPVVGGVLVYIWSWPAIFWFNVVFGVAALVLAAIVLPENSDPDGRPVDVAGAVLGAAALSTLIFAVIDAENSGFSSNKVIGLLCASAVTFAAFIWRESKAAHPLLDLSFLRIPQFATPNVVAFCAYFATFAIFFFTALYLEEVTGYNGGQIAEVFLPMTVLMILASLLAGRWTSVVDLRWSIVGGCGTFALGLLWTNAVISPEPPYLPLAAALALTGIGIGSCVVPITSSVLAVVPPERSGMAASTTNTSREVGAVMGVAILGAVVIGKLQTALLASLIALKLPRYVYPIVINGVLTGQVPSVHGSSSQAPPGQGKLVSQVIHATYSAFLSGLHDALYLSAGLVAAAGVLAAITIRVRGKKAESTSA